MKVEAFLKRDGVCEPFLIAISEPINSVDSDDFYCVVHMSCILKKDVKILGVDAGQATELAIEFAKSMVGDVKIVDEYGVAINL